MNVRCAILPPARYGLVVVLLAMSAAGCHIAGLGSPVSDSLANSRKLSQQGVTAMDRGQQKEANTYLAKAVQTCPSNGEARREYADCLWQRGARAEAITQLEEACRLNPDDATIRVRLTEMHLAMGQREQARASAETAINLNPKLPAAWLARGRVMRASGNLPEALADFHRALGEAPYDQQTLLEVAEAYRLMNQPQRALETLQSLADTYSPAEEPQQVLYLLGLAYVAARRYDDGVESFTAAANRQQPTAEILYRLAQAQWLAGRPGDAVAAAQAALAMEPRHQSCRELLDRIELARQTNVPLRR